MRRLGFGLVVILALALIGDAAARSYAERQASKELQSIFELRATPSVDLEGWPFAFRLIDGSFPEVIVGIDHLTEEGIQIDDVSLTMRDVTFSLSDGTVTRMHAKGGRGRAALSEATLNKALNDAGAPLEVRLTDSQLTITSPSAPGELEGTVEVGDGVLVVASSNGEHNFALELPKIASGLEYDSVEITQARVVLTIRLDETSLEPPPEG